MQTLDCGGVVLDYEGYAIVVGARRVLLTVPEFNVAAALLLAEGDVVDAEYLAHACLHSAARDHRTMVSRIVARLQRQVFAGHDRFSIEPEAAGWAFRRRPQGLPTAAARPPATQARISRP